MKKYLFLSAIIGLLIFFGCDRFEHTFYKTPVALIEASATSGYIPLTIIFVDVSENGSKPIQEWSWDFDGDGIPENYYTQESIPDTIKFTYFTSGFFNAIMTIYDGKSYCVDSLTIEAIDLSSPLADFSYVQPEYGSLGIEFSDLSIPGTNPITNWSWDFDNDGSIDSSEQNPIFKFPTAGDFDVTLTVSDGVFSNAKTEKVSVLGRSVVMELFTGQWCTNCPNAEDALHNLKLQYGSRFSYVEYHFGDELAPENSPIFYYPFMGTLPFGIVNGNELLIYAAPSVEEVQADIENAILPLLQEQLLIKLSEVQTTLTDTLLTGSILIELDPSVSTSNLALVAVLLEDYNDEYLNNHGEPHHNIALKRATFDISTANLQNPFEFEITDLADLPQWYMNNTTGLPEDLTLVLWVQILEPSYNENTCAVYNVIEIPLQ
ncbi:MAG: PKD domain-containing protein [Candidatus Cloacimonadales bacterium]|nr:PKD domain-containing protein [Candidatus Cloacimonadales bacterium]